MSRYTRNRAYRHHKAAVRKWKYEQMSQPRNISEQEELANMAMTPTKRTQEEHNELIKKVVQMRAQGVTFTGIAEALCEKYNVNTKDVQNIYYRQQAKQQTEQVESKQEENDTEALGSVIASGIEHATDHESNELPEIILWRSSKTRKTMIRCESDGVKIKIDVTDPKVLKGVMDELAMMLNAAVWGV